MASRQRGHQPSKPGTTSSPAQGPVRPTTGSSSWSTVRSASARAASMASTTRSTWSGVIRTDGGSREAAHGADDRPAHQAARSVAATRCTVPRGPYVFTSSRRSQRAARTSARVVPAVRMPSASSAAAITWACMPTTARVASADVRRGRLNPCLSRRRAHTCSQERARTPRSNHCVDHVRGCRPA